MFLSGLPHLLTGCVVTFGVCHFIGEDLWAAEAPVVDHIRSQPFGQRPAPPETGPLFESLPPERTGVTFTNELRVDHPMSFLNIGGSVCGGVSIGDVNGDGAADLFLLNGLKENRLYLQSGDFKFTDVSERLGSQEDNPWGTGAAMIDIDNDGDLDLYICNYDSPNQLFINEDHGERFVEAAQDYGLDVVDASLMPAFADFDNDGDLDLYLLTYRYYRPGGRPSKPPVGFKNGKPYILSQFEKYYHLLEMAPGRYTADNAGRADHLFRNNGDGTFTEISEQADITEKGHGLSATWWDFNADGFLDIYVGNDFLDPDHLYRNNGDGTFTDVIADTIPITSQSSMGADCGDLNNDGLLDFISLDMAPTTHFKEMITQGDVSGRRWLLDRLRPRQTPRNVVYLNTGTARFMEVAFLCGLARTDWSWAPKIADFDNDGWPDVFVSNGYTRLITDADAPVSTQMMVGHTEWELWKPEPELRERNFAFRNQGDLQFEDVSQAWGLDHEGMSLSAAYGDLDNDGDLDLVVASLNEPVAIYRNQENQHHRITVRLQGAASNRYGLGALIRLKTSAGPQVRQMNPMTGYLSCNQPRVHFGLGTSDEPIEELSVQWPSGHVQSFSNLPVDRSYVITEPPGRPDSRPRHEQTQPLFQEVSRRVGLNFSHEERPFDDYRTQPLLPGKLSQLGPGLAWGDADGDGDEDLYVGGAAGQTGRLFINRGNGSFAPSRKNAQTFLQDKEFEDMSPLWLDVDGDGDLDLFVSSGSNEYPPGSEWLKDRIYLNDGNGGFARAPDDVLPDARSSSGMAAAADFDGDGDLDLFVAGRLVPGHYPESPRHRLLRNEGGKFVNVTDSWAAELKSVGMVTAALWSDANGDGRPDLLLTEEWGAVRLFLNQGNRLVDATDPAGLGERSGWWNSITGADVDSDGDIDYLVLNAGLNTKYGTPTARNPALLYYGDMDGSGTKEIIEAKVGRIGLLPLRGLSSMVKAVPSLIAKFRTHRSYGSASLAEIFTQTALDSAIELKANQLASGSLINDGNARFTWKPLPRYAQASPGFGAVSADLDADGRLDFSVVQNLFTREPDTGLWRGGIGFTLSTGADGQLLLKSPAQTGLVIDGDAKGLTVCDLNGDHWPDLVATQNNDTLLAFQNQGVAGAQPLAIQLKGPKGNPSGIGAMVRVHYADGVVQAAEVYAGSGYLSQSSSRLFLGRRQAVIQSIETTWPDGSHTALENPSTDQPLITIPYKTP